MVFGRKKKISEEITMPTQEMIEKASLEAIERSQSQVPPQITSKKVPEIQPPEVEERIVVVKELPTQQIRKFTDENGVIIHFRTVEECLTELMNEE